MFTNENLHGRWIHEHNAMIFGRGRRWPDVWSCVRLPVVLAFLAPCSECQNCCLKSSKRWSWLTTVIERGHLPVKRSNQDTQDNKDAKWYILNPYIDEIWLTNDGIQMRRHAIICPKSLQARDIHIIFIKGIWGTILSERQLKSSVRFCGLMAIIKKGAVGSSVG